MRARLLPRTLASAALLALGTATAALATSAVTILPIEPATELRGGEALITRLTGMVRRVADGDAAARLGATEPLVLAWRGQESYQIGLADGEPSIRADTENDLGAIEQTQWAKLGLGRPDIPGARPQLWFFDRMRAFGFTGATPAYRHGVFGTQLDAAALTIVEAGGTVRVAAGPGAVFEDRVVRLSMFDPPVGGDAVPVVVTVKSTLTQGSALAVIGQRDGAWRIIAETPPLGAPNRWLNPAGVADFDGDGTPDVALVRQPHTEGVLELWSWRGGGLVKVAERAGYSNHAFGSPAQELAAVIDLGDGPLLALPTFDRRALALVSFRGGTVTETARIPLPARVLTGVAALGRGRDTHVLVGLEDGRVADVRPEGLRP